MPVLNSSGYFLNSNYDKDFKQLSDELILRDKAKGKKLSSLSAKDNQLSMSGGDFNAWLDTTRTALNEEPVRGYSTYANDTHQYALQSQALCLLSLKMADQTGKEPKILHQYYRLRIYCLVGLISL